jgi:hypothetical protein
VRVVGEGSPTGGKSESEFTGAVSDLWGASSKLCRGSLAFPQDRAVSSTLAFLRFQRSALRSGAALTELSLRPRSTARDFRQDEPAYQVDEPLSRLLLLGWHSLLAGRPDSSSTGRLRRRPARFQQGSEECGQKKSFAIRCPLAMAQTVLNADLAIRFAFSSLPIGADLMLAQAGFALPVLGRLTWPYSTVNEGVTRFNGILNQ